jgi:arsenite methyltransferase
MENKEEIRESIRKNYANVALNGSSGGGCCGSSCCCDGGDNTQETNKASVNNGYSERDLNDAPAESNMGLGCGNPVAIASLKDGETVLDLGSGGGFDCFLARKQVGETGFVIGVDMTPEMIKLSRLNAEKIGCTNVEFSMGTGKKGGGFCGFIYNRSKKANNLNVTLLYSINTCYLIPIPLPLK